MFQEPEVKDNMTENEIMTLNWLPGVSMSENALVEKPAEKKGIGETPMGVE